MKHKKPSVNELPAYQVAGGWVVGHELGVELVSGAARCLSTSEMERDRVMRSGEDPEGR